MSGPADALTFAIPTVDEAMRRAALARQARLTKPAGSLGRLEEVAVSMAALQARERPVARPAVAVLFAADHPVVRHGVSAYPQNVTRAMLANFAAGGAAASVLADRLLIPLFIVDVGVREAGAFELPLHGGRVERAPVADDAVGDIRVEDAMSVETFRASVATGRDTVRRHAREAAVVIVGEMGIGNTTVAAAVSAAVLGGDPKEFVGRGTGVDGERLALKAVVVRDAVNRVGGGSSAAELLRRVGGRELAAMFGAMGQAIEQGSLVLVDGFIATAAALVLCHHVPGAREGMMFAHRSAERAHARVLRALDARPLLDLSLRLGEGSGAFAAFPLVELACELHGRMATFESAHVPERE